MKKTVRIIFLVIIAVLVIGAGGFVYWGETPLPASPTAVKALESSQDVKVEIHPSWIIIRPVMNTTTTGFIFYPGGRVDYRAYAPLLSGIASSGYMVAMPRMPLNLAILGIEKASEIMEAFPNINHWVIGGHSLGGTSACMFIKNHPEKIQGLLLWASYPAESDNLSELTGLKVTSIYGTLDGLATREKIDKSVKLLPKLTEWKPIEGGNHAQFGDYGVQPGDNPAVISPVEQQRLIIQYSVDLLTKIEKTK